MKTITLSEGTEFTYGENAQENSQLTRSAHQNHYWLHVNNHPSAHGILQAQKPTKAELTEAAAIIKQHSKAKELHRVAVDCVQAKYVKIMNNNGTAQITSKGKSNSQQRSKTIYV